MNKDNKRGRPITEIKRDKEKRILFTECEFEQLNKLYKESTYVKMNDMIRDILLKNEYKVITIDQDLLNHKNLLLEECRRIGNNFNQMIKLFNQKKLDYFTHDEIQKMLFNVQEIQKIYSKIESTITNDSKN